MSSPVRSAGTAAQITIRPADLTADRETLIALLLKYLTARSNERRWRWFYEDNPHGRARAWVAIDEATAGVIGSGAIIPRLFYCKGALKTACLMADFWIHPDYRSLGPAIKLQRACIEGAHQLGWAFYDLPQGNMPAVYRRMRLLGEDRLMRLSKPLRTGVYVEKKLGRGGLSRAIAAVGDVYLRLADRRRTRHSCVVARHEGELGAEFSVLAQEASRAFGVCVARTADYLTWRYRDHYFLRYEIFTARRQGRLLAYAAVGQNGDYAEIVDLFGLADHDAIAALILGVADEFRSRHVAALTMGVHAEQRWLDLLARAGFAARDARAIVISTFDSARSEIRSDESRSWYLTYGDIDC